MLDSSRITLRRAATAQEWDDANAQDPAATFFQTRAWPAIVSGMGNGWRDASEYVSFGDGHSVVVPRMSRAAGLGAFLTLESVPPGLYGSPVGVAQLPAPEAQSIADVFRGARIGGGIVVESPHSACDLGGERSVGFTHALEFPDPLSISEEDLVRRYRKGHRAAIARARREGVHVHLASEPTDFESHYAAYVETVRRWERRPFLIYPRGLFIDLASLARNDSRIRLWVATRGGQFLAGALFLHQGRHAAYWHGATTDEGRRAQAGHLAVHSGILDSARQGRSLADLLPSGGLEDVVHFKTGFGAQPLEFGIHHFRPSALYSSAQRARSWLKGPA